MNVSQDVSRETRDEQRFYPDTRHRLSRMSNHISGIKITYLMDLRKQIRRLWLGPTVSCTHCGRRVIYYPDRVAFKHWLGGMHCYSIGTDDSTGRSIATPDVPRETIDSGRYDMFDHMQENVPRETIEQPNLVPRETSVHLD